MLRFTCCLLLASAFALGGCAISPACDEDETEFCPIANKGPLSCSCVKNTASGPSNPTKTTRK